VVVVLVVVVVFVVVVVVVVIAVVGFLGAQPAPVVNSRGDVGMYVGVE
jgi:hypothetical protein